MSDKKSEPASKVQLFPVSAAIWRNTTKDGKAFYSVTFERKYKDEAGKWTSSDSFSGNDLLLLEKVAFMAYQEVAKLRANDKQATTEE